ncbi:fatty acyl-CoA reductase wat-like [Aedes albopictus]|uniref:Fatty acyl-CoA reductase n=1 Tax=Aedes albopictus TaxID=7160 RepID=A0ABM1Z1X2_AEDAL
MDELQRINSQSFTNQSQSASMAPAVRSFYKDATVLICGATGFLGQILLEKILRTLEPRTVYLLIRRKKGLDVDQRLQMLLQGVVFDRVRSLPIVSRVQAIEMDMTRPDLGLNEETRRCLIEEVNVVFQLAALVNFMTPLDRILKENVQYNLHLYGLMRHMKNLRVAMHVSTMFSNCDRKVILEKVYSDVGFGGYDSIVELLNKLDQPEKEAVAPIIIGKHPNNYTFSKKCIESKLQQEFFNMPIGIFRPPSINASYEEPLPGWTNNLYGYAGFTVPAIIWLYSAFFVDDFIKPMFAPVDYCANALLVCAVDVAKNYTKDQSEIPVFNYADSHSPILRDIFNYSTAGLPWPQSFICRHFMITRTTNEFRYRLSVKMMLAHATIFDRVAIWRGYPGGIRKGVERALIMMEKIGPVAITTWEVETANIKRVLQGLDPDERAIFQCDMATINWERHYADFVRGIKKYVLNIQELRICACYR